MMYQHVTRCMHSSNIFLNVHTSNSSYCRSTELLDAPLGNQDEMHTIIVVVHVHWDRADRLGLNSHIQFRFPLLSYTFHSIRKVRTCIQQQQLMVQTSVFEQLIVKSAHTTLYYLFQSLDLYNDPLQLVCVCQYRLHVRMHNLDLRKSQA